MPYIHFDLPEYPVKADVWDKLALEKRPIAVYGMGNGADKLINRFGKYGIEIADFFASDGFVRGHSFHGKRVKSYSEISEEYPDFVIAVSFASSRPEVLELISARDSERELYIPDMPVAGEDEYFDRAFFNENYSEILKAYNSLADGYSRNLFAATVNYKLFGKLSFLEGAYSTKDELYSLLPCGSIKTVIDAGAYNGDTAREAGEYFPRLCEVIAVEPDPRSYRKLKAYAEGEKRFSVRTVNAAVWSEDGEGDFIGSGNRNSSISSTASHEHKLSEVPLLRIDGIARGRVDYIKYDVEGAELEALVGSREVISSYRPALLVSAYHRSRDIFSLVNYIHGEYPFYKLYLRRLRCIPAWELDIIAIPEEQIQDDKA